MDITTLKQTNNIYYGYASLDDIENISIIASKEPFTDCGLILWNDSYKETTICFASNLKDIRAYEFLDFSASDYGMVKGTATLAHAKILTSTLKLIGKTLEDIVSERIKYYFDNTDTIYPQIMTENNLKQINALPVFYKKRIPWGMIKSTQIVPNGSLLKLKTLENESGITITADENTYIMIGRNGEIYAISKDKFHNTYELSDTQLDIFELGMTFIPEVMVVETGEYIPIDQMATLCYPKKTNGIRAMKLSRRTRVYNSVSSKDYFLGRPGDYLAIRNDDYEDMYIINEEIFYQTYKEYIE